MSLTNSSPGSSTRRDSNPTDDWDLNTTLFKVRDKVTGKRIRLEVIEPVTITAKDYILWSTSFTTYLIRIKTNHYAFSLPISEVRRRYSDFCWLRSKMCYNHPNKDVPPLPSKNLFYLNKFSSKIIEERRFGLGKFLQRVMRSHEFLSDLALHYFLQTNLSIKEIDERISEDLPAKDRLPFPSSPMSLPNSCTVTSRIPYVRSTSCSSSSDGQSSERSLNEGFGEVSEDEFDDVDVSSSEECPDLHFQMST